MDLGKNADHKSETQLWKKLQSLRHASLVMTLVLGDCFAESNVLMNSGRERLESLASRCKTRLHCLKRPRHIVIAHWDHAIVKAPGNNWTDKAVPPKPEESLFLISVSVHGSSTDYKASWY
jgi:hypothetical protein